MNPRTPTSEQRRRLLLRRRLAAPPPIRYAAGVNAACRSLCVVVAIAISAGACGRRGTIRDSVPPQWMTTLPVTAITVEGVRVSAADGHRAVLLKLSRFPDSITHSAESGPGRIRLTLAGPAAGNDMPEERVVPGDAVVNAVRVARSGGTVHVIVDLQGDAAPTYTVHELADWIMIRLAPR